MKSNPIIVIKYGGNAMTNGQLKQEVLRNICKLSERGYRVLIVHGGGPFIKRALEEASIQSEFIDGHRKTTRKALKYVEMALKGEVNSSLVGMINNLGYRAVGLSGKDGKMVTATKRLHQRTINGITESYDLGQVGDVENVDTSLPLLLMGNGFMPVITCLAADENGDSFNINADMFAGHLAGALGAEQYLVLTDVNGLMRDQDDETTLIPQVTTKGIMQLIDKGIIQGGMIPKLDSCVIALEKGAHSARIINGTNPGQILMAIEQNETGTLITH